MPTPGLIVVKCPLCGSRLETSLRPGASIECPSCDDTFVLERADIQASGAARDGFVRFLIPLGYLAFLVIPLGGVIYYVATREEPKKDVAEQTAPQPPRDKGEPPAPDRHVPDRTPKPPRGSQPREGTGGTTPTPREPVSEVHEAPFPHEPVAAREAIVEVAPEPHEAVAVAPAPREFFWRFPTTGFTTKWETIGVVSVRVAHVGVGKYPLFDPTTGTVEESKTPALVLVIEARLTDPDRDRMFHSWTNGSRRHNVAFLEGSSRQLAPRDLPPGLQLHSGLKHPIPLPKDGSAARDVILFEVPPEGTKELELQLEAVRVREDGNYRFRIPAEAWKE
jgi:hypothetical protein